MYEYICIQRNTFFCTRSSRCLDISFCSRSSFSKNLTFLLFSSDVVACPYIYRHKYTCRYIYIYAYVHIYIYIYMYIYIYICRHIYMRQYIHTYESICVCVYIYTCTYVCRRCCLRKRGVVSTRRDPIATRLSKNSWRALRCNWLDPGAIVLPTCVG